MSDSEPIATEMSDQPVERRSGLGNERRSGAGNECRSRSRKPCSRVGNTVPDRAFGVILLAAGLISVWLLLMPWVPAIAESTMKRFHLRSSSFFWWAVQQPIPAMYNFANETEIRDLPPNEHLAGLVDPLLLDPLGSGLADDPVGDRHEPGFGVIGGRMINHFPTREFTFANGRHRYLQGADARWFVLESRYRGTELRSTYELQRAASGGWQVTLLPEAGREAGIEGRAGEDFERGLRE